AVGEFFYRIGCLSAVDAVPPAQHANLDQGLVAFADTVRDSTLAEYLSQLQKRDAVANALSKVFEDIDVLILPTLPIHAFEAGSNAPAAWHSPDWMTWNPYTPAFNVSQSPALSYPVWP